MKPDFSQPRGEDYDFSADQYYGQRLKWEAYWAWAMPQLQGPSTPKVDMNYLRSIFNNMMGMFWQKRARPAFFEMPARSKWPNSIPTLHFMIHFIIPELRKVDPRAKLEFLNMYRGEEYQRALKSTSKIHPSFNAADVITSPRGLFRDLARICDSFFQVPPAGSPNLLGIGIYDTLGDEFVHIDTRVVTQRSYTWIKVARNRTEDRPAGITSFEQIKNDPVLFERLVTKGARDPSASQRSGSILGSTSAPFNAGDSEGEANLDIIHDDGAGGEIITSSFALSEYLTPEEYAGKGIIAQIYTIDDWALAQLSEGGDSSPDVAKNPIGLSEMALYAATTVATKISEGLGLRADTGNDPRRRYVQTLVESEFWRRRYQARSIPGASGRFNPYPVAGFPALIMKPDRPVIAMLSNVTHSISVSAGTATTSCSFGAPRYWDEGDPWFWFGGWGFEDINQGELESHGRYLQRYPYWLNRNAVPTNSFDERGARRVTGLDKMYLYLIGSKAIEYRSNHAWAIKDFDTKSMLVGKAVRAIKDRQFASDIEFNKNTLSMREYNTAIASTDKDGFFAENTIARKVWGKVKPGDTSDYFETAAEDMTQYTERYGVKEKELFVDFLQNTAGTYKGRLLYSGRTFGGSAQQPSQRQRTIIEYMEDLERRQIGSGVDQDS